MTSPVPTAAADGTLTRLIPHRSLWLTVLAALHPLRLGAHGAPYENTRDSPKAVGYAFSAVLDPQLEGRTVVRLSQNLPTRARRRAPLQGNQGKPLGVGARGGAPYQL